MKKFNFTFSFIFLQVDKKIKIKKNSIPAPKTFSNVASYLASFTSEILMKKN